MGLVDFGDMSYLNGFLQCILACDPLRRCFLDGGWVDSPLFDAIVMVVSAMDERLMVPLALLRRAREVLLEAPAASGYLGAQVGELSQEGGPLVVHAAWLALEDVFNVLAQAGCKSAVRVVMAVERTCQRCGHARLFAENPDEVVVLALPPPGVSGCGVDELLRQLRDPVPPCVGEVVCPRGTCCFWDARRREWRPQRSHNRTYFLTLPAVLAVSVLRGTGAPGALNCPRNAVMVNDVLSIPTIHGERPCVYRLHGVMVLETGRWVAYVRRGSTGPWYRCDGGDVDRADVVRELLSGMLFYVRQEPRVDKGSPRLQEPGESDNVHDVPTKDADVADHGVGSPEAPVGIADPFDSSAWDPAWLFAQEAQWRARGAQARSSVCTEATAEDESVGAHGRTPVLQQGGPSTDEEAMEAIVVIDVDERIMSGPRVTEVPKLHGGVRANDAEDDVSSSDSSVSSEKGLYERVLEDLCGEPRRQGGRCGAESEQQDSDGSQSDVEWDIHVEIDTSDLDEEAEQDRRDAEADFARLGHAEDDDDVEEEGSGPDNLSDGWGEYEDVDEDPRCRDQRLESGLVHMLMGSVPRGILASRQRRNKKWSGLLERVQARTQLVGEGEDEAFWDYLPAHVCPWLYPQRTPSGHFIGCMPTRLYVAKTAQEDGFVSPERMVYEKMLGLEGPEPYDPVMRSLFFTVLGGRRMDSGTGATYVKRGLRGALHHKEDIQELSARFGDQLLPSVPVTSYDARTGVAELAALDACEGPAAYWVTLTLAFDRLPGIQQLWQRIVRNPDARVTPHLPYLSRCWSRAQETIFNWILLGEERPFGNARLYARRTDYEIGQGGENARGNLGHSHAKIWTEDKIMDPDPVVRAEARAAVQARLTANLHDLLRGPLEEAMWQEMRHLVDLALVNQVHQHTFSCTDSEGHRRCHLPQRSREVGEFLEIHIGIPDHVVDRLEAMGGVARHDPDTGEVKLCDWLRAGRYLPRRGMEFPMAIPIQPTLYRCNGGCHICGVHCDEGHFANSYLVHYQGGQEERTLVRPRPRDKAVACLEMIDRHLRKRAMGEKRDKRRDPDATRQCIPEPELVALLQREPIVQVMEVVDWVRGDIRPIEFVHYSTSMPSERYKAVRWLQPDAAREGDAGPLFGGPDDAEELLSRVAHLPPRCQPSLGQLRVYLRSQGTGLCPDGVARYNMGPPALCAAGQVPMKYFNEIVVRLETDRLDAHQEPLPWQRGLPRGLWAAYRGFFGLRGERLRLRPPFFYHPRYAHLVNVVFVDKMHEPGLLATICEHWRAGTLQPPAEVLDYVAWPRGRCIGVTKHVEPRNQLRWLVHCTLAGETPFDDEVALFCRGAYAAAEATLSADRVQHVLDGTVTDVLKRFFTTDLRHWGTGYHSMWKILMRSEVAIETVLEVKGLPVTALERYYLPVLEDDIDAEHVRRYREFEDSVQQRHCEAMEGMAAMREAARALGVPCSADGFLARAHPTVHGFAMKDAAWEEELRSYDIGAARLHLLRQTSVVPGAEELSRDGPWVVRRYINPVLLTGPAGSGKSYVSQALAQLAGSLGLKWEYTSTTAFVAVRGGGAHIHHLGRFHKDDSRTNYARMAQYAMNRMQANPVLRRYMQELDVLFIGEFGSWTDRLLSALDTLLREVRRSSHPFGNLMIIADGDHHQLKPICQHGEGPAMTSMLVTSLFSSMRLTQLVRCRDDALARVQEILRKVTPTTVEMDELKELLWNHCHPGCTPDDSVGAVRFFAHKNAVAEYNKARAKQVPDEAKGVFECEDREVRHYEACELTPKSRARAQDMLDSQTDFPRVLTVWVGLQVMYRGRTRDVQFGYVKCAVGEVTAFDAKPADGRRWVDVLWKQPRRWEKPVRIRAMESESVVGPEGRRITRTQVPLISAECWTLHMGIGMTLSAVATEIVMSNPKRRMWERGQLYMLLTRVHYLHQVWLTTYEPELLDFLVARPDPALAVVDAWLEQTDLLRTGGGKVDPPLLPVHVRELLARPCRTIGNLASPPTGHMWVYLLQQEHWPYQVYWGYSEDVERRQAQHNSNTSLANKRCRGRADWLLAAYASTFPNTKEGHAQAKAARHWAKSELLQLESAGQHRRVRGHGWRSLHDNILLLTDLVWQWNKDFGFELRVVATDTNFDVLRQQRSGEFFDD